MAIEPRRGRHIVPPEQSSFYTIRGRPGDVASFSSADSAYGSQIGGPCGSPPRRATHNITKAKYHMEDIGEFAKNLEESATKAFPNRLRTSRYTKVQVLLLHWESDDLFVLPEVQDLGKCLDEIYHFGIEYYTIPVENSHLELMMKIGLYLKQFEDPETLLVVYYGGHARIDESRQSTWCATRERDSAWLQWSAIQTLLERSSSDVLILLDCCAGAASATFPNGQSVTETISASSWDAIAPDPGRYSFTSALIEVLSDWEHRIFSAAMLHAEVLARLKHPRPEQSNGRRYEARSTPVHFMMTANHKKPSIELCKLREAEPCIPSSYSPSVGHPEVTSPLRTPTPLTSRDNPMENALIHPEPEPESELYAPEPSLETPHVMLSVALERNQQLDLNAWQQWLSDFPALAKYVKIQGVFESHSALLLISLPVSIWNMLPDHDACNFVAFIRSNNLAVSPPAPAPTARNEVTAESSKTGAAPNQSTPDSEVFHHDNISLFTNFTGSTAVMGMDPSQIVQLPEGQQLQAPKQTQTPRAHTTISRPEIGRSQSTNTPGPPVPTPTDQVSPITAAPVRYGTSAGTLTRSIRKPSKSLFLPTAGCSVTNNLLKPSPSSTSIQSLPSQSGHSIFSGSTMVYQPIMTHARATRRSNFIHGTTVEKPDFADHVESMLEKYFFMDPMASDGTKEHIASNLGVEFKDVVVSLSVDILPAM